MKVILSAYACEPFKGSEPEIGLQTMLSAATRHEVWVLTRSNNVDVLTDYLVSHPARDHIHLVGVEASGVALWLKRKRLLPVQVYYDLWQRAARRVAERLNTEIGFEVAHHITFATFWARVGVAALDLPLVWGPVGGGVRTPHGFGTLLGWKGVVLDTVRLVVQRLAHRVYDPTRRRSAPMLALAQNGETATRLNASTTVRVLPNATAVSIPDGVQARARTKEVAFVGRLVPLKAGILAVRAMSHVGDPETVLVVCGEGGEHARIARLAKALGVNIRFEGWLTRNRLLESIASSAVLLHVALHEEAGLAVAEALSLGTPVVCLAHGGPAELVRRWASAPWVAVDPTSPGAAARELAVAIEGFLANPAPIPEHPLEPQPAFGEEILRAYDEVVQSR